MGRKQDRQDLLNKLKAERMEWEIRYDNIYSIFVAAKEGNCPKGYTYDQIHFLYYMTVDKLENLNIEIHELEKPRLSIIDFFKSKFGGKNEQQEVQDLDEADEEQSLY